jgi:CheY-like chemotaxis protein
LAKREEGQMSSQGGVLVVEDEPEWHEIIEEVLEDIGSSCHIASDRQQALDKIHSHDFFLVILDMKLGDKPEEGRQLLDYIAEYSPTTKAVILTGHGSIGQTKKVFKKHGDRVLDYLEKSSFDGEQLKRLVHLAKKRFRIPRCFMTGGDCTKDIKAKPRQIFVAMPYSSSKWDMDDFYAAAIRPAIEECEYVPLRADERFHSGGLMCNICRCIQESFLCVVDISDWNSNVLLELGMMYGMGKTVILLKHKESAEEIPADLGGILYVDYKNVSTLKSNLQDCLKDLEY